MGADDFKSCEHGNQPEECDICKFKNASPESSEFYKDACSCDTCSWGYFAGIGDLAIWESGCGKQYIRHITEELEGSYCSGCGKKLKPDKEIR